MVVAAWSQAWEEQGRCPESGCLRTSLVPARWYHTSYWSLGSLTCYPGRETGSVPQQSPRTSHQSGEGERLTEQSSVTQTSLTMANCILGGERWGL